MTHDLGSMPLEGLIRHTPLAIAAADVTGRLTMLSPALQRLMNRSFRRVAEDEMVAYFDLFACDGMTPLRTEDMPLARALRGEVVTDAVVVSRTAGEPLVYLRCNASQLLGEDDEVVGAVVLVQDVTPEILARQAQAVLRERLLETVNHELRTPLAKIVGHVELLDEASAELGARLRASVEVIARSAGDLVQLTGQISDLADLEARTQLTKTLTDVTALVQGVLSRFADRAAARDLALAADVPAGVTATIDSLAVDRATAALLDNAVTYAPAGSTIDVVVSATSDCVEIHVLNTGSGIPASETSRLIRPFERGDHEFQPVNSKGMGLPIAHTVAIAHGGQLLLSERSPSGLCATLSLPRSDTARRALEPSEPELNLRGPLTRLGQPESTHRRPGPAEQFAAVLMDALNGRITIEQAKGVLAHVHSISVDEAFVLMRLYATTRRQALGDVALAVIEDPASLPDLTTPRSA